MNFIDLKIQYKRIEKSLNPRLLDIMENARFIMGQEVTDLETQLASYTDTKHCISCSSGTDALIMALMALDIREGDAVFLPTFTFFSTGEVVSFLKATPIFIDVYEDTFNMNVEKLQDGIDYVKNNTDLTPKLIIPVDLFGQPADYDEIKKIAKANNLKVVEDGAQGFGGKIDGKKACSFGDIAATSFFPAKPLGCYGDGGAVFTDDDMIAEELKSIRIHGQSKGADKYLNERIGINGRLDTIQAAVLLEKLKIFDEETKRKNDIVKKYNMKLKDIVSVPYVKHNYFSSWAQYSVLADSSEKRDLILKTLSDKKIPTAVYYKAPLHTLKLFSDLEYIRKFDYSVSNDISKRIFSLPMHAYLTDEDIELITSSIKQCF